jgi:hypothetical protein
MFLLPKKQLLPGAACGRPARAPPTIVPSAVAPKVLGDHCTSNVSWSIPANARALAV